MKNVKATVTLKDRKNSHVKDMFAPKAGILSFCRDLSKAAKSHVSVHFDDELHPVRVEA